MAWRDVDPAELEGEALRRWYLRSPEEVEAGRRGVEAERYRNFFEEPSPATSNSASADEPEALRTRQPSFTRPQQLTDIDPGPHWTLVGPNRWPPNLPMGQVLTAGENEARGLHGEAFLDRRLAGPGDGGEFVEIDSKAKRQRRQWELREGRPWPTVPETGRNFDRSHIQPKADGGTDTIDNIEPKHPDDHRREHMERGDFKRWGARSKGGRGGPTIRGLGVLSLLPGLLGLLNGRIRTDTPEHMWNDLLGYSSEDDLLTEDLIV